MRKSSLVHWEYLSPGTLKQSSKLFSSACSAFMHTSTTPISSTLCYCPPRLIWTRVSSTSSTSLTSSLSSRPKSLRHYMNWFSNSKNVASKQSVRPARPQVQFPDQQAPLVGHPLLQDLTLLRATTLSAFTDIERMLRSSRTSSLYTYIYARLKLKHCYQISVHGVLGFWDDITIFWDEIYYYLLF